MKGWAFLNSCDLYISLVPHQFPDEEKTVHWAVSYMKTGRAALFAQRVIRYQATYKKPRFATWADFRKTFIVEFTPRDERRSALARLETTRYYQGKRSVDDYVDEFRDLVELSGYTEGLAIVIKFQKGLNRDIQDVIANIPIGRPDDDNPEAWFSVVL